MFVVLDTNHFTEFANGSPAGKRLIERIEEREADAFSCIVAAEESLRGWFQFVRRETPGAGQLEGYARLQSCIETLCKLTILPFDRDSAAIFGRLRVDHRRTGTMDLKIAAICLANEATLLTRNLADFNGIAGLRIANWLD